MSFQGARSRRRLNLVGLLWGIVSLAMATAAGASPVVVVDTGSPSSGVGWILSASASLGGDLAVNIYTDGGDTPGSLLDSKVVTVSGVALVPAWRGPTGLDWVLDAGTYWVTFEPSTFLGALRFPAPSPLANYAYDNGANWGGDDTLDFGVRILGDTDIASVPDRLR